MTKLDRLILFADDMHRMMQTHLGGAGRFSVDPRKRLVAVRCPGFRRGEEKTGEQDPVVLDPGRTIVGK